MDSPAQFALRLATAPSSEREISRLFARIHDEIRNGDGFQPDEALEELVKILFVVNHRNGEGRGRVPDSRHKKNVTDPIAFKSEFEEAILRHSDRDPTFAQGNTIRLSIPTLERVLRILAPTDFSKVPLDLKSAALRVFLSGASRRGLGVFLTPDSVVRMIIEGIAPSPGQRILDPCCGSGSFLLHILFHWRDRKPEEGATPANSDLWACEKNDRILRLAELNLGPVLGGQFHRWQGDSLASLDRGTTKHPSWFGYDKFDIIVTNPPFGVHVSPDVVHAGNFATAISPDGRTAARLSSEVLFMEQCLRLLVPGGLLAIVVPNSVVTAHRYDHARQCIDRLGQLVAVVSLPPETFLTAGTQSTTSVLFFAKRDAGGNTRFQAGQVFHARVGNIGLDGTGRTRRGSELPIVTANLRRFLGGFAHETGAICRVLSLDPGKELTTFVTGQINGGSSPAKARQAFVKLGDVINVLSTGKTPARSDYTDRGSFIIKVGNLTGSGIDWSARDRNFVTDGHIRRLERSREPRRYLVEAGDILLTSSAHSVKYIAKKADIVWEFPAFVCQPVAYVGELLLVRCNRNLIDPLFLLSYLRTETAQAELQRMVRGQTAHLYAEDAAELRIPRPQDLPTDLWRKLLALLGGELAAQSAATLRRFEIECLARSVFGHDEPTRTVSADSEVATLDVEL